METNKAWIFKGDLIVNVGRASCKEGVTGIFLPGPAIAACYDKRQQKTVLLKKGEIKGFHLVREVASPDGLVNKLTALYELQGQVDRVAEKFFSLLTQQFAS